MRLATPLGSFLPCQGQIARVLEEARGGGLHICHTQTIGKAAKEVTAAAGSVWGAENTDAFIRGRGHHDELVLRINGGQVGLTADHHVHFTGNQTETPVIKYPPILS